MVDQPPLQRLVGRQEVARERHLLGPSHADRLGEEHREPAAGQHADARVGVPEPGLFRRDQKVALQCELEAARDRLDQVAALIALVADVKRLMDVADEVSEEDQPFGALLIVRPRLQQLRLRLDGADDAVVVAGRRRDRLRAAVDVQEMLLVELREVQPGAVRDLVLFGLDRLGARFVGKNARVRETADLQIRVGRCLVALRQRVDLLLLLGSQ